MREHPIIFRGSHPVDILERRKTMTRRTWGLKEINKRPNDWELVAVFQDGLARFSTHDGSQELTVKCPYGGYGDRLRVKETFAVDQLVAGDKIVYKADGIEPPPIYLSSGEEIKQLWKSSMFMPRKASRILLEITEIRAERLQSITEEDAIKEGVEALYKTMAGTFGAGYIRDNFGYRRGFEKLWNSLNAKRGYEWEANPWVWPISFKRLEGAC